MNKLLFALIACFGLSITAYSQQIFDGDVAFSPAQSTKTSVYYNKYGGGDICVFSKFGE